MIISKLKLKTKAEIRLNELVHLLPQPKSKKTRPSLLEEHSHMLLYTKVQWEAFLRVKEGSHWWIKHQGTSSRSLGKQESSQPAEETLARRKRSSMSTRVSLMQKQHHVVGAAIASFE